LNRWVLHGHHQRVFLLVRASSSPPVAVILIMLPILLPDVMTAGFVRSGLFAVILTINMENH
jgi:TRAP-type C4-dicarboxylate transport system permease large subunit